LRQDRIGDVLVSVPVIRALRRAYPDATMHMLFSRTNFDVRGAVAPYVDRAFCYYKTPAAAARLLVELRSGRYDVVVDLLDAPSANAQFVMRWCRARYRVGILHDRAGYYTHAVPLLERGRVHVVERIAQLLLPFGIDPGAVPLDLEYQIGREALRRARTRLGAAGRPLRLGVNISPRYWGRDNFIACIRWLQDWDRRFAIVVCGSPEQQGEVAAIVAATGVARMPQVASFEDYAAMIHECDLVLTPDTSTVHAAAAWKIPMVGLYHWVPGHPALWLPYRSPHRAVVSAEGFAAIPLGDVQEAFRSLVAERFPVT
jgi:ADP-heptose:LPS heptosyltransferase